MSNEHAKPMITTDLIQTFKHNSQQEGTYESEALCSKQWVTCISVGYTCKSSEMKRWKHYVAFMFPPTSMIHTYLEKIRMQKRRVTLVSRGYAHNSRIDKKNKCKHLKDTYREIPKRWKGAHN